MISIIFYYISEETMAVYYKFKSARDYDSIPMDGPFISVGTLKEKIFESKHLGRGTDFDLVVTNAQTNEGWFYSLWALIDPQLKLSNLGVNCG